MKKFFRKLLLWSLLLFVIRYTFQKFVTKKQNGYQISTESIEQINKYLKNLDEKLFEVKKMFKQNMTHDQVTQKVKEALNNLIQDVSATAKKNFKDFNLSENEETFQKPRKNLKKQEPKLKSQVTHKFNQRQLNSRQFALLEEITKKRKLNMREVSKLLPEVSERTLRRDMDRLENIGLIRQVGKTRDSYYEIIKF